MYCGFVGEDTSVIVYPVAAHALETVNVEDA
jgi:hypothetical protein